MLLSNCGVIGRRRNSVSGLGLDAPMAMVVEEVPVIVSVEEPRAEVQPRRRLPVQSK